VEGIGFIRDLAVVMMVAGIAGWICRRLGLSVVVGYLAAGIIIGPYTPRFQLVEDEGRVNMLAQFGLVFLIFSVGMGLSLGRLQRLGVSVAIATAVAAVLVLNAGQFFGAAIGWDATKSLFLAGMLMVSSSAIIAKVLEELNATHERSSQLAIGITVLEDVVAVVMLTVLTSVIEFGGAGHGASIWATLGRLGAFIVFLLFLSVMIVPKLLKRLSDEGATELRTILLAGLLFSLAWLAWKAGYSVALSAFVLGAVVAGTRYRAEVERGFEALRQIFGAVFFVAIGMLVDVKTLPSTWPMILGVTVLVLIARPIACAIGLMAVGNSDRESIRAGLCLTPIGEFSFVMAQMGVSAGVVPASFYGVAVGICLTTSLTAPAITRRSGAVADWLADRKPNFLRDALGFYQSWLARLQDRRNGSMMWRFVGPRLIQVAMHLLFLTALLIFWSPVYARLEAWLTPDWPFQNGLPIVFWIVFGAVLLGPLIALWRNAEAIAMILADGSTRHSPRKETLRPLVETTLKTTVIGLLVLWLVSLLPLTGTPPGRVLLVAAALGIVGLLFSSRLVRWHNRIERELSVQLKTASSPAQAAGMTLALLDRPEEWNLDIDEVTLPSQTQHAGRTIREVNLRRSTGCSIVGIDRHGFTLNNPSADERLYPGDRILLLGSPEQLATAEGVLTGGTAANAIGQSFSELTNESIRIPEASPYVGKTLVQLDLMRRFSVQICGIKRGQERRVLPAGGDQILGGDLLLLLGTHDRIRECRRWLAQPPAEDGAAKD
jgi:CPA2 family monovalent cation:H+ antiporter-2